MFRITPIGSCRIATPLRLARDRYGFALNQDRVYGYTHSSAEAVQLMRYLKGEVVVDPLIEALVSRRGLTECGSDHEVSDLYVVEISSAKLLQVGETCIQINYLVSEYADFFADRARSGRFWDLADAGDQVATDAFLQGAWAASAQQRRESAILRLIRRSVSNEADLRRDIRALIDGLPAVLFVTHVDALTSEGVPIPSRSRFIRSFEAAVRAEGGLVYNPTAAMRQMGQDRAIEDDSDSLAHFTEDFARGVFQDWFDLAIAPAMDRAAIVAGDEGVHRILVPHVEARLAAGDAGALARRLEGMARALPDCSEVHGLLAGTYAAIGQADAALRTLQQASATGDRDLGRRWLALALELSDPDAVRAALDRGIDGFDGPQLLAAAELLARTGQEGPGQDGTARRCALQALQVGADQTRAADLVVDLCDHVVARDLDPALSDRIVGAASPSRRLRWLLFCDREVELLAELSRPASVTVEDLASLAGWLARQGNTARAVELIALWRKAQGLDRLAHPDLRSVVDALVATSVGSADLAAEITALEQALQANPQHVEARIRLRALRRDVLTQVRALAEGGDLAALEAMRTVIEAFDEPIRDYDMLRMRALFAAGDFIGTMAAANCVLKTAPDNLSARAHLMRAAMKAGDPLTVEEAALQILEKADEDSRRLADEAQDRLNRTPVLSFRLAREEVDPLRAVKLYQIARRDPALAKASDLRLRRLAAELATTARGMEAEATATPFLAEASQLFPDNAQLRLATARHLVRQRDFAAALPHWEYLCATSPENESHAMQLNRCRDRLRQGGGLPTAKAAH